MNLTLLSERFAIANLLPTDGIPVWATQGHLSSITRTRDELSIVTLEEHLPPSLTANEGWRAFQIQGPINFSEVGILNLLTSPLAEAGISIFAISTYDTDYVLIKDEMISKAIEALRTAGHHLQLA
jgi:hypothetical protein